MWGLGVCKGYVKFIGGNCPPEIALDLSSEKRVGFQNL